jgi:hypothetical protein
MDPSNSLPNELLVRILSFGDSDTDHTGHSWEQGGFRVFPWNAAGVNIAW